MAKDCYLEIDGKRIRLTNEQLKALGLYEEPKANPFERTQKAAEFYYINLIGRTEALYDHRRDLSNKLFDIANYCTDKSIMEQRALHETLNRLLWRFSIENDGDKINWNSGDYDKYFIYYNHKNNVFNEQTACYKRNSSIYFHTREIARRAIDEIILPFMEDHPDFIW